MYSSTLGVSLHPCDPQFSGVRLASWPDPGKTQKLQLDDEYDRLGSCRFQTAVVQEPVLEAPGETIVEHNGAAQKANGAAEKANAPGSLFDDKDTEELKVCTVSSACLLCKLA